VGFCHGGLYIAASHFEWFYEREKVNKLNSFAFTERWWAGKKQID
jgi:hypothetical protein